MSNISLIELEDQPRVSIDPLQHYCYLTKNRISCWVVGLDKRGYIDTGADELALRTFGGL
jgi:hypothetical protein